MPFRRIPPPVRTAQGREACQRIGGGHRSRNAHAH
jgi:hypothetical protein